MSKLLIHSYKYIFFAAFKIFGRKRISDLLKKSSEKLTYNIKLKVVPFTPTLFPVHSRHPNSSSTIKAKSA